MRITATEFKVNMGQYIALAAAEDIIITKNGKDIALLTNVETKKKNEFKSLRGIIKDADVSCDEIREERLGRYD